MGSLPDPFQFDFFRNALIASLIIGPLCGLLGVYIVLRGMSYIGHGLAHAVFGGAAVAYVVKADLNLWAGAWGFCTAILINFIVRRYKIGADAAIGVITTSSYAIGVAVMSLQQRFTLSLEGYLFGSILGITQADIVRMVIVGALVGIIIFMLYKQLLFTTFDQETAHVYGIHTGRIDNLFSLALAATIVISVEMIGATLIAAAIVIPPITARLLTQRFDRMIIYSMIFGAVTAIGGIWFSFYLNTASGATIVLVQAVIFVIALVVNALSKRNTLALAGIHDHHI